MRIRSIKPEFWTSEDIAALDWTTRLLFIGLWSYVDDNGVGRDVDKLIVADLFPLEDDPRDTLATVSRGLQALYGGGQISRYDVDGKSFLYINAWESHQRIDRPNKARYPLPTCGNAIPRDTLASMSRDPRENPATGAGEQRSRGTEEQGTNPLAHSRSETKPSRFEEFWDAYGKKVGKKDAEAKYVRALKKPGVTEEVLITAAAAYVIWERGNNQGGRFIKDPARWLTGEHWRDERPANRPATRMQEHLSLVQQLEAEEQATIAEIGYRR